MVSKEILLPAVVIPHAKRYYTVTQIQTQSHIIYPRYLGYMLKMFKKLICISISFVVRYEW